MAVTRVTYSPDFAQWKCHVSPGKTTTLPGGYALSFSVSNRSPQTDVKATRKDSVDTVLRVPMQHEFHTRRQLDPDRVSSGLSRLSNDHGQSGRRWKCRERLPVDIFRQNRFEYGFARR
jgi:hypothetical protein